MSRSENSAAAFNDVNSNMVSLNLFTESADIVHVAASQPFARRVPVKPHVMRRNTLHFYLGFSPYVAGSTKVNAIKAWL